MKIRKKRFQLLEILIALSLIVICAVPLIHTFVGMHIEQKEEHRAVQANNLIRDIHAKLTEDLFARRIPWQEIESKQEKKVEEEAFVKRAKELNYQAYYLFEIVAHKITGKDKEGETHHYLVKLHIGVADLKDPKNKIVTHFYEYMRTK